MYRYLPLVLIVFIAAINTTTLKVGLASKEPFRRYPRPKNRRVSKGNHLPCLRKKVESREDIQASLVLSPHSTTHQSKSRRSRSSLPPTVVQIALSAKRRRKRRREGDRPHVGKGGRGRNIGTRRHPIILRGWRGESGWSELFWTVREHSTLEVAIFGRCFPQNLCMRHEAHS